MDPELDDEVWTSEADDGTPPADPPRTRWFALKAGVIAVAIGAIVIGATAKSLENVAPSGTTTSTTTATDPSTPTTEADTTPPEPTAEPASWPVQIDGVPASAPTLVSATDALEGEVRPGLYLWADFEGWHLRLVNGDGVAGATGTIDSDDGINGVSASNPSAGTVSGEGTNVTFSLPGDVAVAGVDFTPGFFAGNVVLVLDDATPIGAEQIYLGQREVAPESVPIVLQKPTDG